MTSDADLPPTQQVRPRAPLPGEPVAAYEPAEPAWLVRIEDRLRSLQTALAIVGVVAVAALAVSIYALIHDKPTKQGASQQHVADLDSRISRLEGKAAATPTSTTTNDLATRLSQKANASDVQKLNGEIDALKTSVGKATSGSSSATATVGQLKSRVDQLAQQVSDLSSQSTAGTSTTTTTTP